MGTIDNDSNADATNESETKKSADNAETSERRENAKESNAFGKGENVAEVQCENESESVQGGEKLISVMSPTHRNDTHGERNTPALTCPSETPVDDDPGPNPPPRLRKKSSASRHGEEEAPDETDTEDKEAPKDVLSEKKKAVEEVHSENKEALEEKHSENKEAFKPVHKENKEAGKEIHSENKESGCHEMQKMKDTDAAREKERILDKKSYVNLGYTETEEDGKKPNTNTKGTKGSEAKENDTRNRSKTQGAEKEGKDSTGKEDEKDNLVGLKKELSFANCVGMMVGGIIGTGIFVSPRGVLKYTGSVGMSLVVWATSGVMAILGALCYAELGTMIPQSGGNYTYLYEAYGSFPAFIYLWMMMTIGIPGGRAVAALTFANYVLQPFFPNDQSPPESALRIIGILLLFLLTYINSRRVRWATRVQDSMALTKVFALVVIIIVGMYHLGLGTTDNYKNPMEGTVTNPSLAAGAFYHTFYAYEGWDSLNGIMEELKDPFKNMPRAIAVSLTCVITVYMLTNVAYFAVVPKEIILSSPAVAVTFGDLSLGVMAWTIPIFVACSVSGALNGSTFNISRLLYVGARNGHLPRLFSFVHVQNNTPVFSLFFVAFMSMWMFVTSEVHILINYISFAGSLMNFACMSSFFWFRYKHPDLPRPIKVWIGIPILYFVFSFFLCVMPVVEQPMEVVAALVVLGTGLPVYYFFIHRKKPKKLVTAIDKVTHMCQLVFMAVPEEKAC